MFNEVSLFCRNIFRNISQRTRFLQTEQFLLNIKIFQHGVKSSCKNCLMRLFHEAIQKHPFKIHLHGVGERINCVCGEPGLYPKARAQAGVSGRGMRDEGCCCFAASPASLQRLQPTQNQPGGRFSLRKTSVPKANKQLK